MHNGYVHVNYFPDWRQPGSSSFLGLPPQTNFGDLLYCNPLLSPQPWVGIWYEKSPLNTTYFLSPCILGRLYNYHSSPWTQLYQAYDWQSSHLPSLVPRLSLLAHAIIAYDPRRKSRGSKVIRNYCTHEEGEPGGDMATISLSSISPTHFKFPLCIMYANCHGMAFKYVSS